MVLHNNWFVQIVEWIVEFVLGRRNTGDIVPADDPRIKYIGRWLLDDSGGRSGNDDDDDDDDDDDVVVAKADWPCSQLQFQLVADTSITSSLEEEEGAPPPNKLIGLRLNLLRVRVHVEVVAVTTTTTTSQDGEDGDSGTSKSSSSSSSTTILMGPGLGFWNKEKTYNVLLPKPPAPPAPAAISSSSSSSQQSPTSTTSYTIKVSKLTQAAPSGNGLGKPFTSVLQFHGIELPDDQNNKQLRLIDGSDSRDAQKRQQQRRIAVIGASDTAGYCVDGTPDDTLDAQMLGAYKYDNCHETSHALLSRRLHAEEVGVQAMAGIGLTQNGFAKLPFLLGKNTMPDYYPRTLQTDKNEIWDFPQNQRPDLVLLSLGGNDFNHQGTNIPSDTKFNQAYGDFLDDIIRPYTITSQPQQSSQQSSPPEQPDPITIVSICGQGDPTETDRDPDNDRCRPCPHVEQAVEAYKVAHNNTNIRVEYIFIPCDGSVVTGIDDIGCDGHKNRLGQERVANFLEPKLRHIMNWYDDDDDNDNDDENQHNHQNRIFTNETTAARTRIDSNGEVLTRSAANTGKAAVEQQEAVINSSTSILAIVSLVLLASAAMFIARRVVMSIRSSSSSSTAPISYSLASAVDKDIDIDTDDDDDDDDEEESVGSGNCNV